MKENLLYSESIAHARPSWRRRLMLVLMVALPLFLQAQTITFSKNKVSIGTAIENIRRQTNYSIDFASDLIDLNRQINVRKEGTDLREVLDKMTAPELAYAFNGRHIIVTRKKANQQSAPAHQPRKKSAAGHVLKGTVTDEATGEPPHWRNSAHGQRRNGRYNRDRRRLRTAQHFGRRRAAGVVHWL